PRSGCGRPAGERSHPRRSYCWTPSFRPCDDRGSKQSSRRDTRNSIARFVAKGHAAVAGTCGFLLKSAQDADECIPSLLPSAIVRSMLLEHQRKAAGPRKKPVGSYGLCSARSHSRLGNRLITLGVLPSRDDNGAVASIFFTTDERITSQLGARH